MRSKGSQPWQRSPLDALGSHQTTKLRDELFSCHQRRRDSPHARGQTKARAVQNSHWILAYFSNTPLVFLHKLGQSSALVWKLKNIIVQIQAYKTHGHSFSLKAIQSTRCTKQKRMAKRRSSGSSNTVNTALAEVSREQLSHGHSRKCAIKD